MKALNVLNIPLVRPGHQETRQLCPCLDIQVFAHRLPNVVPLLGIVEITVELP